MNTIAKNAASSTRRIGPFEVIGPVRLPCRMDGREPGMLNLHLFCAPGGRYSVVTPTRLEDAHKHESPLVRISSMCVWAHIFGSCHCDCGEQLELAKERISKEGNGVLIFCHDQHGKGVGLVNHYHVYADGQLHGRELVIDAYEGLGYREDYRNYGDAVAILKELGVKNCRLLTNNPHRVNALEGAGITVVREALEARESEFNRAELEVKRRRLGHLLRSGGDGVARSCAGESAECARNEA